MSMGPTAQVQARRSEVEAVRTEAVKQMHKLLNLARLIGQQAHSSMAVWRLMTCSM